jgi:hypothetical protein
VVELCFNSLCFKWVLVVELCFNSLHFEWVSLVKLGSSGLCLKWGSMVEVCFSSLCFKVILTCICFMFWRLFHSLVQNFKFLKWFMFQVGFLVKLGFSCLCFEWGLVVELGFNGLMDYIVNFKPKLRWT